MSDYVPLFRGALGLNMRADPARLRQDPKTGMCELAEAVNVDVTDSYRVSRRPGRLSTSITLSAHSLFAALGTVLFVSGDTLYRMDSESEVTALRTGLTPDARMSFTDVYSLIYFSNGYETGVYDTVNTEISAWEAGQYIGPSTTRTFDDPPAGHIIEHFNGRIYIAQDSLLWWTEPFGYNWVDHSQNLIVLPSRITMVRGVTDGLYVSTLHETYFLAGAGPEVFAQRKVASYPVIEGTDVICHADDLGEDVGMSGVQGVMATARDGICFMGPEGTFINLSKRKLYFPVQSIGTAYIYRGKYVVVME